MSLALEPVPVVEQPVASTTSTLKMTIRNADRLTSSTNAPEQRHVSKLPLLERYRVLYLYGVTFIR
jgi:hypothetical protein